MLAFKVEKKNSNFLGENSALGLKKKGSVKDTSDLYLKIMATVQRSVRISILVPHSRDLAFEINKKK